MAGVNQTAPSFVSVVRALVHGELLRKLRKPEYMSKGTGHITILLVDEHLLSVLKVRPTSKGVDVVAHEMERGAWSATDGSLEAALRAFVEKHGLRNDDVYTVLPRHEITSRILVLPSNDLEEIKGMIRLSAEEYVPYPLHDLVIDQSVLARLQDGSCRVMAVFAHKSLVSEHMALLDKVGIEPRQIYLSTACLASAAIAVGRPEQDDRYALVNLSSGGLEAIVVRDGHLEYGRAVATVQDWSLQGDSAVEAMHDLAMEVRGSLSAYRRESEDGMGADTVYLCSDWADVTRPAEELSTEIGRDVGPVASIDKLVLHGRDKLKSLALVSLGAALAVQGRAAVSANLVPDTVLASREMRKVKRVTLRFALMAAVFVGSLGMLYVQAVQERRNYLAELDQAIQEIEPRAENIRAKQRNLAVLQDQVSREGSLIDLLSIVCDAMPSQNINITHVNFHHGEQLGIAGRARDVQYVDRLTERLRATGIPQLSQATQAYTTVVQERSADVLNYAITMHFPGAETANEEEE